MIMDDGMMAGRSFPGHFRGIAGITSGHVLKWLGSDDRQIDSATGRTSWLFSFGFAGSELCFCVSPD